jgi:PAS domain-containing protein
MENASLARAREYIEHGWSLCAIKPQSKAAYGSRWQEFSRDMTHWEQFPEDGMGLIHGLSGTCSLDLDNLEAAHIALAAVGVDLPALLEAPDAVRLIGAPGRGKLLYRTTETLTRNALNWPDAEGGTDAKGRVLQRAVLELRAGAVQDVLPPSIHPDTGEPYRWEGDWRALPELPAELLAIWRGWSASKRAMEGACPWNDTPAIAEGRYEGVERKRYAEGESVIAAFNEAHELRAVLESFDYRRAGPRLISPHSSSGIPGVVILPGSEGQLCYVHHASDPLCDGHAHDAFSVWCQLEHQGDVTRAVRAAAEILGISHAQVDTGDGAEIAARLLRPKLPAPPERPRVETTDPPGPPIDPIPVEELAQLERWLRLRHWGAKPIATTQGALAFAAAMTARRYVTYDRQPTNLMLGVADTSIAGLLPMRGALYEAANAGGEARVIRSEEISSGSMLRQALYRHPRMFWVSTDYGYMVGMQRKQTSGAFRSALDVIQEVYEGSSQYNLSAGIVGGKNLPPNDCRILFPGFSALVLASDDQMRDIAQRSQYGRGAVQQILFVRATDAPGDDAGTQPGLAPPDDLVTKIKDLGAPGLLHGNLQYLAYHQPKLDRVELGPGALDALEELRARLASIFHESRYLPWRGIAKGGFVTANRLATSLAAWRDPESPLVTIDLVQWVSDWVAYHITRAVEWYSVVATVDGEFSLIAEAQEIIFRAGPRGITSSEMRDRSSAWKKTKAQERQETLDQLLDDGLCVQIPSEGGRTVLYVDRSYITPESAHV